MRENEVQQFDFTGDAWESLYAVVDHAKFSDKDAQLIYYSLRHQLKVRFFGDYLKRYIYQKAGLTQPFSEVSLKEYQLIIRSAFLDNHTPQSFVPTTAKLSALSKNWLTQQTVRRNVVFLLGFGLAMSVDDVNTFLTKALQEQEINPKDPFEVTCWYCYKHRFNYLKFEQLWQIYKATPADSLDMGLIYSEHTIGMRHSMHSLHNDAALMAYLAKLKENKTISKISFAARQCFDALYNEAKDLVARLYNTSEEERQHTAVQEYIHRLSLNDRMYEVEKRDRIDRFRRSQKVFHREDITESDLERMICASIPKDRHGNLTPGRISALNEQFSGKRFSRQRIGNILSGNAEVTRFDLITLNFFVFSQKLDIYPNPKTRYIQFQTSMDAILEKCFLGEIYVQNPYECFILMCILSDDPLCTYADVWELSYRV